MCDFLGWTVLNEQVTQCRGTCLPLMSISPIGACSVIPSWIAADRCIHEQPRFGLSSSVEPSRTQLDWCTCRMQYLHVACACRNFAGSSSLSTVWCTISPCFLIGVLLTMYTTSASKRNTTNALNIKPIAHKIMFQYKYPKTSAAVANGVHTKGCCWHVLTRFKRTSWIDCATAVPIATTTANTIFATCFVNLRSIIHNDSAKSTATFPA